MNHVPNPYEAPDSPELRDPAARKLRRSPSPFTKTVRVGWWIPLTVMIGFCSWAFLVETTLQSTAWPPIQQNANLDFERIAAINNYVFWMVGLLVVIVLYASVQWDCVGRGALGLARWLMWSAVLMVCSTTLLGFIGYAVAPEFFESWSWGPDTGMLLVVSHALIVGGGSAMVAALLALQLLRLEKRLTHDPATESGTEAS